MSCRLRQPFRVSARSQLVLFGVMTAIGLLLIPPNVALVSAADWKGTPVVEPIIPRDSSGTSQSAFNNLAWQQFIALNWVADPDKPGQPDLTVPPAAFGTQRDERPVVWESFKEASEVFRPDAEPPTGWGEPRSLPSGMLSLADSSQLKATSKIGTKGLFGQSKFTGGPVLDLSEFTEAGTGGAWLTAQAKMKNYITLFEKRLNEDEFNYINSNQLYDADVQTTFAQMKGINLPDGSAGFASYGTVGAIEIKAAWIQLDDPSLWPLFKTSQAYVSYPSSTGATPPELATVGLVGLHIIRKTPNAQQFVWSTFEHINNAPSVTDIQKNTLQAWYTYYNPNCDHNTDYYHCVQNKQPQPHQDPPEPYNAPVQVVRTTPISATTANNIAQLNTTTWATIKSVSPNSVFLNYQLVNVLWPNNNTPTGTPGATTPLTDGNAQPPVNQQPVANTIMETYHQNINCLTCHVNAPTAHTKSKAPRVPLLIRNIAGTTKSRDTASVPLLASDYSFLFSEAGQKPASKTLKP